MNPFSKFGIVLCLALAAVAIASFRPPVAQGDDAGPTVAFLDNRDSLVYGPPVPPSIDVSLVVSGNITATEPLTLDAVSFISPSGQPVPASDLVVMQPAAQSVRPDLGRTFTFNLPLTQIITPPLSPTTTLTWGSYSGLLVARLGDNEPVVRSLTLVVGPKAMPTILSPKVVISVTVCPGWLLRPAPPWLAWVPGWLLQLPSTILCQTVQTAGSINVINQRYEDNTVSFGNLDSVSPAGEDLDQDLVARAAGTVVQSSSGQSIDLGLKKVPCPRSNCPTTYYLYPTVLRLGPIRGGGNYEGTFYLDPANKDHSPSVPVTVIAKDYWPAPALVLFLGILVSTAPAYLFGQGQNRAKERARKRTVKGRRAELARDAEVLRLRTIAIHPDRQLYAVYSVPFELRVADQFEVAGGPDLNDAEGRLATQTAFLVQFDAFLLDHRELILELRKFLGQHPALRAPNGPALISEMVGRTGPDAPAQYPIESVSVPVPQSERVRSLRPLLRQFREVYQRLVALEAETSTGTLEAGRAPAKQQPDIQRQLLAARAKLWAATSAEQLDAARAAIIEAASAREGFALGAFVDVAEEEVTLSGTAAAPGQTAAHQASPAAVSSARWEQAEAQAVAATWLKGTPGEIRIQLEPVSPPGPVAPVELLVDHGDGNVLRLPVPEERWHDLTTTGITSPYRYIKPGTYKITVVANVAGSSTVASPATVRVSIASELGQRLGALGSALWDYSKDWWKTTVSLQAGVRWAIIIASGLLVVYFNNPTFGSLSDYLTALLWGTTTEAAATAIGAIFGNSAGVGPALSGLLKL